MSLTYPYQSEQRNHPIPSLPGRSDRPRPLISVCGIGPTGSWVRDGLLDTGADDTVFPQLAARIMGIDLTNAPTGIAKGVGLSPVLVRYAVVTLRIVTAQERRQWQAWVAFTAVPMRRPLLGYAGFLQFFDAVFRGAREEVELTINHRYQGT